MKRLGHSTTDLQKCKLLKTLNDYLIIKRHSVYYNEK